MIKSRFNSQRDGILLNPKNDHSCDFKVSIPNGMEFYLRVDFRALGSNCFNSQRDGILLQEDFIRKGKNAVSIPNGMEFYGSFIKNFGCSAKFQFPTGWNSTEPADDRKVEIPFQFPTGWNSTFYHWSCRRMYPVSIPNGMEFY